MSVRVPGGNSCVRLRRAPFDPARPSWQGRRVIWLIRHGETDANAARVVQRPEVALSARGRRQADRLAARLGGAPVRLVVSSDLRRAVETAERIVATTGAPLELDPGLRERDFGDVRGTPYAALTEDIFGPGYAPPNGETWAAFDARVDVAWARLLARAAAVAGDVAVVTHGLVCAAVAGRHGDLPPGGVLPAAWGNACVTLLDPPRALRLVGCTAHLGETPPARGGAV